VGGVWSFVEGDGFEVNGSLMHTSMKAQLRGLRDGGTGLPIFGATLDGNYTLGNEVAFFLKNGAMSADSPLFSGDWTQIVYAVRQDLTFKLLDQGVIQDSEGEIVYNLAQQDMVALRCVMRLGFQIANHVTNLNTTEATRYPFAGIAVVES
jgi:HK97 family phage major capsid protein